MLKICLARCFDNNEQLLGAGALSFTLVPKFLYADRLKTYELHCVSTDECAQWVSRIARSQQARANLSFGVTPVSPPPLSPGRPLSPSIDSYGTQQQQVAAAAVAATAPLQRQPSSFQFQHQQMGGYPPQQQQQPYPPQPSQYPQQQQFNNNNAPTAQQFGQQQFSARGAPMSTPQQQQQLQQQPPELQGPLFDELRAEGLTDFIMACSRQVAADIVSGGASGSFIIRPSSQAQCVALTLHKLTGQIDHLLVSSRGFFRVLFCFEFCVFYNYKKTNQQFSTWDVLYS